jgi:type I restriction enzyme S subunit
MYGANEAAVLEDQTLPRYIRITDVKADGTLDDDTFRSLEEDIAAPYLLQDGDILLARSGATVGKSFQYLVSWGRAAYAGYLIRCRLDKSIIFPRFANYYFQTECYWACIRSTLIQATIENFSAEKYKDLTLPLPAKDEQQQIAAFLDWKTGQIDALIARKQELLEKLKEKRIAVITQAVTQGLNPAAPMRDSGIPWLGQVPQHWDVCQVKRVFQSTDYGISEALEPEGRIAVLRMGNIENGKVVLDDLKYIDSVPPELLLRRGDLLYNRTNSLDLIGKVGMFTGETDPPVSFASYLVRIRTEANCVPEFFAYMLNTEGMLGVARSNAFIAIGQCNLNPSRYGQIRAAIPPKAEQEAIVHHLDDETAKLDGLSSKAQSVIDRLTEYRTALITAATTGKIDVRKMQIPAKKPD